MPLLSLSGITKSFGQGENKTYILNDLSFNIYAGEVIAIVGPSGSGKTTFLQIAGLLDNPDSGEVIFQGTNLAKMDEAKRTLIRRNSVGFIYQFHHLLPEFTALENLIIPQLICGRDKITAETNAKLMLSKLALENKQNHLPSELSGGEQQRVALLRGMINQPSLLLADEPTGNLDPKNADHVMDLLITEAKQRRLAVAIVTHNLKLAKCADKVLTLVNGKIEKFD